VQYVLCLSLVLAFVLPPLCWSATDPPSPRDEIDALRLLDEARARLQASSTPGDATPADRVGLALDLVALGFLERAEGLLDAGSDALEGVEDGLAARALALLARAEFAAALEMKDALAARSSRSPGAALAYADLLLLEADLAGLNAWARKRPDRDPVRLFALARLRYRLNELREAEDLYRRALEAGAPARDVLLGLAHCAQRLRRLDEARALVARALVQEGPDAESLFSWGRMLVRSGRATEAVVIFEKVAEIYPWHAGAHYQMGNGYARRNYSELEADSPDAFPRDEEFLQGMEHAGSRLSQGSREKARRILEQLTRRRPASCEPPAGLASLAWNDGDYREAERWCRESLRREPAYGRAHAILAKAIEGRRMELEVHRAADEEAFQSGPMPEVPGIEAFVLNWDTLTPRHKKRIALSLAPFDTFIPVLVDGGQTFYVKLLHERLSETPQHESLRDERISYDARLWDDVRGCGGNDTVIGIEDVERSIFGRDDTALHELAHQVHHVLLEEDKARIERAFTAALQRDAAGEDVFLNRYSASSVWEYLAEGVHAWETRRRDRWDTRQALRHRLRARDRELTRIARHYTGLRDTSPYRAPALAARAWNEMEYNRMEEARTFIDRAAAIDPEEETVLGAQVHWLLYSGDTAEANDLAGRALDLHPASAGLSQTAATARLHGGAGRAAALAVLEEARERVDPGRRADIEIDIGRLLWEGEEFSRAAAIFRDVLAEREDEPGALQGLLNSLAFLEDADREEFEDVLTRLVRKRSGMRTVRADAAVALARRGAFEEAREQVREGLLNAPDSDQVLAAAAYVEWRAGEPKAAARYADQAITGAGGRETCWNDLALLVDAHLAAAGGQRARAETARRRLSERAGRPPEHIYIERETSWRSVHRFDPLERHLLAALGPGPGAPETQER